MKSLAYSAMQYARHFCCVFIPIMSLDSIVIFTALKTMQRKLSRLPKIVYWHLVAQILGSILPSVTISNSYIYTDLMLTGKSSVKGRNKLCKFLFFIYFFLPQLSFSTGSFNILAMIYYSGLY